MAASPLRIGIAGLGTVGAGTLKVLRANAELLALRAGRELKPVAVSARARGKNRGVSLDGLRWYDDPLELAVDPEIDVVAELIGGADGVARGLCELALRNGKHVVTANKALLAHHGAALARAAETAGRALAFEAAVAGGIPIIKALREGLAANRINQLYGILNGTCNYILTQMRTEGREFGAVLAEAQKLGYAEADPSFDVDGVDAGHKLAILAAAAFGGEVDFGAVSLEGIRHVTLTDIRLAEELGYRIKLLGIARRTELGIEQRVHPCMVPLATPIASVDGVYNAVVVEGDSVGTAVFEGRGAGEGPTASAVIADLMDIARGHRIPAFGVPAARLAKLPRAPLAKRKGPCYVRLMVVDRPGIFAAVAASLRDHEISMESVLQRGRAPGAVVPVVMTLHEATEAALQQALAEIARHDGIVEPPRMIRIETFA
ncbi:MAG: homoserine dehydrogenase [Rhodospirillales bacterium]|nr:homoserine dehydrogenase [Rhodospirillales bacterium]